MIIYKIAYIWTGKETPALNGYSLKAFLNNSSYIINIVYGIYRL